MNVINDTLRPECIILSALVFEEFPSLRTFIGPVILRAYLSECAEAAKEARRHMVRKLAQMKIKLSLKQNVPQAAKEINEPVDSVLIWRETLVESRIGECMGLYIVKSFEDKSLIFLVQKDGDCVPDL